MALNFQDIAIPFVAGQTQTADDPLVQPPGVVRLANGEFDDRGNINVVDGVTSVPVATMTGETPPSDNHTTLRRVHDWKGTPLIENFDGIFRQQVALPSVSAKFALAAGSNNRKRDSLRCRRAGVSSIAEAHGSQADDWNQNRRPSAGVLGTDAAVLGDYTCVVWCEEYGTAATFKQVSWLVRYKDGSVVGRGRIRRSALDVKEPRVVAFNGFFHLYGLAGGELGYLRIDPTATQNVAETFTLLTAVGNIYTWLDVALSTTHLAVSVADGTAPGVVVFIFTQAASPVLVGAPVGVATPGAPVPLSNFFVDTGGSGVNQAFVTFYACAGSTQTLRWFAVTPGAVALGAGAQVITPVVARVVAFKSWAGSKANIPVLIDTFAGATTADQHVNVVRYDATSAAPGIMASGGSTSTVLQGHITASLPSVAPGFSYTGSENQGLLLGVQISSVVQNTFQVVDIARSVTAALGGSSQPAEFSLLRVFDAGAFAKSQVPPTGALVGRVCAPVAVPSETYGMHFWSAKFTPNVTNVTDLGQNPTNIQRNTLRYDAPLGVQQFSNLLYLAGGTPLCYDGQDVFEEGFSYVPESTVAVTTPGTGPLSAGSYGIALVYEWYDGQGNRWQSTPYALTFTAAATNSYTVTARALAASLKSGVQIIPYRTIANGTIYYRDSPLGVTPLTDAALVSSEPLYTSGVVSQIGTQGNNALPGVDSFAVHQTRLVAVGGESTRGFFYSKESSPRFPAEFNRASGFGEVPDTCGTARAAASLDDKLILFGTDALAVMFGQGPNNLWAQNNYATPALLQSTEGIRSDTPFVAVVAEGVWYVTLLGPRLLNRSLATALGSDQLPLGHGAVNADKSVIGKCEAVLTHPVKAQVYFWQNTKSQLHTYDTTRDQWSYRGADLYFRPNYHAASVGTAIYLINNNAYSTSALRRIDPSNIDSYTLTLETGWVTFAGLQRFQRLSHLQILATERETGTFASTYEFRLRVYVNYDPTTAVQDTALEVTPLNANSAPFMAEFQLHRQTDTAYKFIIDLRPPVSSEGGNFALCSMLARVGQKRGGAKLPNAVRG